MKVIRSITIDKKIDIQLREDSINASALINKLLTEYYGDKDNE